MTRPPGAAETASCAKGGAKGAADRAAPILSVRGLSKAFSGIRAVNDVTFEVARGEVLGIAGPNGSGKSTLFNIISGVPFPADSGSVVFEGRAVERLPGHRVARMGIARTFQRETVFSSLSAVDNVLLAVEHSGRAPRRLSARVALAEAALERARYPATMHNARAGTLPVYYRKLVMIAGALAMEPRVLLLDEPASSLTQPEIHEMRAVIEALNADGMTILLVEHVLPLLTAVSHRLIVLDGGTLIASGTPAEVIADRRVVEAYLGSAAA